MLFLGRLICSCTALILLQRSFHIVLAFATPFLPPLYFLNIPPLRTKAQRFLLKVTFKISTKPSRPQPCFLAFRALDQASHNFLTTTELSPSSQLKNHGSWRMPTVTNQSPARLQHQHCKAWSNFHTNSSKADAGLQKPTALAAAELQQHISITKQRWMHSLFRAGKTYLHNLNGSSSAEPADQAFYNARLSSWKEFKAAMTAAV